MGVVGVRVMLYLTSFLCPPVILHGPEGALAFSPDGVKTSLQQGGLGVREMSCKCLALSLKDDILMDVCSTVVEPVLVSPPGVPYRLYCHLVNGSA